MRSAWRIVLSGLMLAGPLAALHAPNGAADAPAGFTASLVLGNLDAGDGGLPVAFAYAPDGRTFVARKTGIVDVYDGGVLHVFLDLRTEVNSAQGRGLLGLAVAPDYATTHHLYVLFTQDLDPEHPDSSGTAGGEIVRYSESHADPDVADLTTRVTLFSGYDAPSGEHTVGALHFDLQGNVLATFGDAADDGVHDGSAIEAENLDDFRGKLIRIDATTGLGVPGNPYFDAAAPGSVRSKIYARGFRNAYRFSIDPDNGTLYVGNVGWGAWEALNAFPTTFTNPDKDRNAGWPCYEGGDGVALPQPDFEFAPSTQAACQAIYAPADGGTGAGADAPLYGYPHHEPGSENGSAITAGPKYAGTSNYPAAYDGQIFIADYARDRFQTVDPTTGVATDFGTAGTWGNPVDIEVAPDGNIAYLGIGSSELREIVYTGSNHVPVVDASAKQTTSATAPFTTHFIGSRSSDADPGDTLTYDWDFADGTAHTTIANPFHTFTQAGSYDVALTVSDGHPGGTVSQTLWIDVANTAPTVTLESPARTFRYEIGDTINLRLDAEDAEDGRLTDGHVASQVRLIHLDHFHPIVDFTGSNGSFVVEDHGSDDTYYQAITTVTDSLGRPTTTTFTIKPMKKPVTITSTPPGAVLALDGVPATTPLHFQSIVGGHHEVHAPADLDAGGNAYTFDTWTQGTKSVNTEFYEFNTPRRATTVEAGYSPTAKGLSVADAAVVEGKLGTRSVAVDVSLSNPQSAPVTVDYSTVEGTGAHGATAPADYAATSGTLTFDPGTTTQVIDVAVDGDQIVEGNETLQVALTNAQGAPIVSGSGTVTIVDDDPGKGLRLAVSDVQMIEGDAGAHDAHLTVSLTAPSPGGVTVDYTTADNDATVPNDYAARSGTLTFDAGVTARVVDVPIVGDGAFEPSEALTFALSNPVGAPISHATATIRIANDDPGPALSIGDVATVEGNSGARVVFFTVALSTPAAAPVVATWTVSHQTTNDGDVKRKSGTVTFAPGNLVESLQVSTFADTTVEPDETYRVTLSDPVNAAIAAATATGTIANDDPSAGLTVDIGDAAIIEGNSGVRRLKFTVDLSDPAPAPVTVGWATAPGTATPGNDYTTTHGTATVPSGATTATFSVVVLSDAVVEPTERFTVNLSNATGGATIGRATGTATILDDD